MNIPVELQVDILDRLGVPDLVRALQTNKELYEQYYPIFREKIEEYQIPIMISNLNKMAEVADLEKYTERCLNDLQRNVNIPELEGIKINTMNETQLRDLCRQSGERKQKETDELAYQIAWNDPFLILGVEELDEETLSLVITAGYMFGALNRQYFYYGEILNNSKAFTDSPIFYSLGRDENGTLMLNVK